MVPQTTLDAIDRGIRWSLYALILFLPVGISFVSIFAGSAIGLLLAKRICLATNARLRGLALVNTVFGLPKTALRLPLALFVGAIVCSVVLSQFPSLSISAFFGKILRGVFLVVCFTEAFKNQRQLMTFLCFWIASAFVVGVSGVWQYFIGVDFIRQLPLIDGRVSSCMRQANDFGAYLVSLAPAVFAGLIFWECFNDIFQKELRLKGVVFWSLLLVFLVLVVCLGWTLSRSAWVAFFAGTILVTFFKRKYFPFVVIMIAAFVYLFTPVMVKVRDASLLKDNVKNVHLPSPEVEVKKDQTLIEYVNNHLGSGRIGFWREATAIIREYPIFGSGLNTYSLMGTKFKINWGGYPHNSYLQMTAETGFVGLFAFLFLVSSLFFHALRIVFSGKAGFQRVVIVGGLASLSAHLIQSFFDTTFYSVQLSVLMWLVMGVLACVVHMNQLTKQAKPLKY